MVSTLCEELKNHISTNVYVHGWHYYKQEYTKVNSLIIIKGRLRPLYVKKKFLKSFVAWIVHLPSTLYNLNKLSKNLGINIIHINYLCEEHIHFCLLRLLGGPKYIVTFHGSDINKYNERHWLSRLLCRITINNASGLTAVSRALANSAELMLSKRVATITNGLSPSKYDANVSVDVYTKKKPFVLCVGGIIPVKGHDIAIRAWEKILKNAPDWNLLIAGDGYCRNEFEALSKSLNCEDRIHWLGILSNQQVFALMREAEIMILPSRNEGLPCVLLEAGLASLPVVACNVGGVSEVVTDGYNGRLVPPEDPNEMSRVIMDLVNNKSVREKLGKALRETILQGFSSERMAMNYIEYYGVFANERSQAIPL